MKRILIAATISAAALTCTAHAADVGVSVTVGEPGFYGRIDIGDYPQPRVIYRQPRIVEVVPVERPPVYLRVPPGHARNWRKHCHEYDACGERVYFVQDGWYTHEYVPRYQERHGRGGEYRDDRDGGRAEDYGNDRGHGRGDDHGHRGQDHDRGHGH